MAPGAGPKFELSSARCNKQYARYSNCRAGGCDRNLFAIAYPILESRRGAWRRLQSIVEGMLIAAAKVAPLGESAPDWRTEHDRLVHFECLTTFGSGSPPPSVK
jgi:hypothetical protein